MAVSTEKRESLKVLEQKETRLRDSVLAAIAAGSGHPTNVRGGGDRVRSLILGDAV